MVEVNTRFRWKLDILGHIIFEHLMSFVITQHASGERDPVMSRVTKQDVKNLSSYGIAFGKV